MQAIRKTPSLPNYLNENQVAERLGVSVKLLRTHRWESKGRHSSLFLLFKIQEYEPIQIVSKSYALIAPLVMPLM